MINIYFKIFLIQLLYFIFLIYKIFILLLKIYLSYGEEFKEPFSTVVELSLEKVRGFLDQNENICVKKESMQDIKLSGIKWETSFGFPTNYNFMRIENIEVSYLLIILFGSALF